MPIVGANTGGVGVKVAPVAPVVAKPAPAPAVVKAPPVQAPQAYVVQPTFTTPVATGAPAAAGTPLIDPTAALAGNASYQAQLAALNKELSDETASVNNAKSQYDTSYGDALANLGYTPGSDLSNPTTGGTWNYNDLNSAAGQSYQNQLNSFAGRNMLQSSLYATALNNLQSSLAKQLNTLVTSRNSYDTNQNNQLAQYTDANQVQQQNLQQSAVQSLVAAYTGG